MSKNFEKSTRSFQWTSQTPARKDLLKWIFPGIRSIFLLLKTSSSSPEACPHTSELLLTPSLKRRSESSRLLPFIFKFFVRLGFELVGIPDSYLSELFDFCWQNSLLRFALLAGQLKKLKRPYYSSVFRISERLRMHKRETVDWRLAMLSQHERLEVRKNFWRKRTKRG